MPLATTVIGSFPKPEYLKVASWFDQGKSGNDSDSATKAYTEMLAKASEEDKQQLEADFLRATEDVIKVQAECGIHVVTDGEVRRENYIHYLCRFIEGIDFENLTKTSLRNGAMVTELPTIRGKVSWRGPLDIASEWQKAQKLSPVPVKYTLPGPMTIIGTLYDAHYKNDEALATDLAEIVNHHVVALAEAGCKHIQVDEPLFARQPQKALDYGIRLLDRCFEGAGEGCQKTVHVCCGYPSYLDQTDYLKADPKAYFQLAPAIDASCIDAVSIEDAHCQNDLSLLGLFKRTKVIFGAVKIACSRVETQDEIEERLRDALEHIEAERLIVAPDCGLAYLPPQVLQAKLANMCAAAQRCGCKKPRA